MGFEEKRGSTAAQPPLGDDGDAVTQQLCLVHVVCGQDDGSVCQRRQCNASWNSGMKRAGYGGEPKTHFFLLLLLSNLINTVKNCLVAIQMRRFIITCLEMFALQSFYGLLLNK